METKEKISEKEIVDIILNEYGPVEKIIMFGSRARGEADEYSDTDLIIIKDTDKRFLERLREAPFLPVPADIFVYTPEEFKQMTEDGNPFVLSALAGAKIIYERQ